MNLIKGPTSKVMISTLNSEDILALSGHFYKTKKIIDKIRPLIVKQQGEFTQAELIERMEIASANQRK